MTRFLLLLIVCRFTCLYSHGQTSGKPSSYYIGLAKANSHVLKDYLN